MVGDHLDADKVSAGKPTNSAPTAGKDETRSHLLWVFGLVALAFHLAADACFWSWLSQTDWLFGHFHGPRSLLVAALFWSVLGIGMTIVYFVRSRKVNLGLGCALIPLALLSALLVLGSLAELFPGRSHGTGQPPAYPKPDAGR